MTVMVDVLMQHGWVLRGKNILSCHMICDGDLNELHGLAQKIGMKREWFQNKPHSIPHYDLTPKKRNAALNAGALAIDRRGLVFWLDMWRFWRSGIRS